MPQWIADWMVWVLLVAGIAALGMAGWTWRDADRVARVTESGIEAVARVEGATRISWKGTPEVGLKLSWTDSAGQMRKAETVAVTQAYANTIIKGQQLTALAVPIKYLKSEPSLQPLVVPDAENFGRLLAARIRVFAGGGAVALFSAVLLLLFGRRKNSARPAG